MNRYLKLPMISSEKNLKYMDPNPYLSFCVHSRNDNYGGNMYRRMQSCIFGFFEQAEQYKINSEIVLVDWNPPPNKPLLKDAYPWPKYSEYCVIRIVDVPHSIHRRYEYWKKIPIHNDVAQNVAIRRAKGKFILSTNVDILLSNELLQFLSRQILEEDRFYGINCYFVKNQVTRLKNIDQQLAYCGDKKNNTMMFLYAPKEPFPGVPEAPLGLHTGQANFHLASRSNWHLVRGYPELDAAALGTDAMLSYMFHEAGVKQMYLPEPMRIYHILHGSRKQTVEANFLTLSGLRFIIPEKVLSIVRKAFRQIIPLKSELEHVKFPVRSFGELQQVISDLVIGKRSFIFNDEAWGLGEEHLEEFVVTKNKSSFS